MTPKEKTVARKTRVRVTGRIDNAASATVTIDPKMGLISVKPFRRHREYTLPLETVARMIVYQITTAELADGKRTRKVKRGLL